MVPPTVITGQVSAIARRALVQVKCYRARTLNSASDNRRTGLQTSGDDFDATVGKFPPVQLAFAWTRSNAVPVLLGQVNFFMEFDVCFYRSRLVFEVKPK